MTFKSLQNKKIAFLGLGVENYHLLKWFLKHHLKAELTICNFGTREELYLKYPELKNNSRLNWRVGKDHQNGLADFDILFRSPGGLLNSPGIREALRQNKNIILTSPMKLFFDLCPTKNTIGVTGTKGKGTTSSLITAILKASGKKVFLGGNIGVAPFAFLDKLTPDAWVVLELSSFQLEDMHRSPKFAVITNFTAEHLAPADPNNPNFHATLAGYFSSKFNIAKWQNPRDVLIVNEKLKSRLLKRENKFGRLKQRVVYFGSSGLLSKLPGEHNKENIAAAVALSKVIGLQEETVAKAVAGFKGLEHRLELVAVIKGVSYYDDSFATTPEAAVTAMRAFNAPEIILAGGADKQADFTPMAKEIKRKVKAVILLKGLGTPRLLSALLKAGVDKKKIAEFDNLSAAVKHAAREAVKGDVVLLATGCASFGMFKNYKERGDRFKEEVKKIARLK